METVKTMVNTKVMPLAKILHVEPFVLFFVLAASTKAITQTQLLQDKLCVDTFNQTRDFCLNLNRLNLTADEERLKSQILAWLSQYRFYEMVVARLPRLLWPLCVGSWSDKWIHGRKVMMAAASFGTLLEIVILLSSALAFDAVSPLLVLLAVLPSGLLGGYLGLYIGAYSYMGKNTPAHLLGIRFALIEVCFSVAWPAGTYLGGQLLARGDVSATSGAPRTYTYVFGTALVFEALSFLWVMFAINERKLQSVADADCNAAVAEKSPVEDGTDERLVSDVKQPQSVAATNDDGATKSVEKCRGPWKPLRLLFDLSNVPDMWLAVVRKRPARGRLHVWLLTVALAIYVFIITGIYSLEFQFVQKVYHWDAVRLSNMSTYGSLLSAAVSLILFPVLEKVLRVPLPLLAVVGSAAMAADYLLRGLWLVPTSYYIGMALNACSGFPTIVLRAMLAAFLPPLEIGRVFSFLELVKAAMPLSASAIFTPIFTATIDTNIGLTHLISGCIGLVQVAIFVYVYLVLRSRQHHKLAETEMT